MTASVQTKGDKYYVVIRYKNENGKWQSKWVRLGLSVSGHNKRRAEKLKEEVLQEWQDKLLSGNELLFSEYLQEWLESIKGTIADSTYYEYCKTVTRIIVPWFADKRIALNDLKPYHIQDFYRHRLNDDGVTANTIRHYHANISKALNDAVKQEIIKRNPARGVTLPKATKHIADCYSADELRKLIDKTMGTKLETVILLGAWFGLRRGEIIGLKWENIDFSTKTVFIVGVMSDKGASGSKLDNLHYVPTTKTKASLRSFPMTDEQIQYLSQLKSKQQARQKQVGYNHTWDDFVCVRQNGDIIPLEYVPRAFPLVCKECGLRRIKLHELRHTNISLLINSPNVSMKEVQEWAGHSTYNTTANIYSHVQVGAKNKLSASLSDILSISDSK